MKKQTVFGVAKVAALTAYYKPKKKKRMAKAKVVDPVKERNKLLTTAIKKVISANTVLPILEAVCLEKDVARVTNLETTVLVPFKTGIRTAIYAKDLLDILEMMPDPKLESVIEVVDAGTKQEQTKWRIKAAEGKRSSSVTGENPDNFPLEVLLDKDYPVIGELKEHEMNCIEIALSFVSKDDLRPAMTGILFNDVICATDAHRLYCTKLEGLKGKFILPAHSAKILLAFGGEWKITANNDAATEHMQVCFVREDGVKIVSRTIDARFPDYKVVIPDKKEYVSKIVTDKEFILKELKNAGKFANKSTNQIVLSLNGKLTIEANEPDFEKEYHYEFTDGQAQVKPNIHYPDKLKDNIIINKPPAGYNGGAIRIMEVVGENVHVKYNTTNGFPGTVVLHRDDIAKKDPWPFNVAFNEKMLSEIIHKLPAETPVEIKCFGPTKCAIINEDFLLMPLMLNE